MPLMKAIQVKTPGADFELIEKAIPEPNAGEVLIKVEACGICHGDVIAKEGHFPGLVYPRIPGHEVAGVICKTGAEVKGWAVGQRVGVGWHGGHCFQCSSCQRGDYKACEHSLITGLSTDGGYAEYMTARQEVLAALPEKLDAVAAAPLLCAGRTTFGALKSCTAKGGDLVAIQGLGGLGHLAVQYAVKLGFRTLVLSRGKEKEKLAFQLGAHHYIDTDACKPAEELTKMGGAKVILCTAPDSRAISAVIGGLARHGEAIIVSGAQEMMQVPPLLLLMGERSIRGFVGGDLKETLDFSVLFGITPMVEGFPLEDVAKAYEKMMTSTVHFRAVLTMGA